MERSKIHFDKKWRFCWLKRKKRCAFSSLVFFRVKNSFLWLMRKVWQCALVFYQPTLWFNHCGHSPGHRIKQLAKVRWRQIVPNSLHHLLDAIFHENRLWIWRRPSWKPPSIMVGPRRRKSGIGKTMSRSKERERPTEDFEWGGRRSFFLVFLQKQILTPTDALWSRTESNWDKTPKPI